MGKLFDSGTHQGWDAGTSLDIMKPFAFNHMTKNNCPPFPIDYYL